MALSNSEMLSEAPFPGFVPGGLGGGGGGGRKGNGSEVRERGVRCRTSKASQKSFEIVQWSVGTS